MSAAGTSGSDAIADGGWQRHSYRVKFLGGNGFELAGIVDRPQATGNIPPPASLPVAVFSHCFTCNKDLKAIARISRFLATAGIAVLRYDMTGLGGSDGEFSRTDFSSNVRDLAAAITFAGQELGPVTALVGHSFGGAASLAVAAGMAIEAHQEPSVAPELIDRIGSVVTIAAPSDTIHLAKLMRRMNPDIEASGSGDVEIGGRRWTITREMVSDFDRHRLADALPSIRCPVLVFHSPDDTTVAYDHAIRITSLIRDTASLPAASLITLPGADHLLVNQPADLDFVSRIIAAFLHRHA